MDKVTVVRLAVEGEKFEILVKPDPALEYKLGKRKEISGVLVSDEVYSDSGKGTRASTEKLMKAFKTTDPTTIAALILQKGDLNLTTDHRSTSRIRDSSTYRPGRWPTSSTPPRRARPWPPAPMLT